MMVHVVKVEYATFSSPLIVIVATSIIIIIIYYLRKKHRVIRMWSSDISQQTGHIGQCWVNVGLPSATVAQHSSNIGRCVVSAGISHCSLIPDMLCKRCGVHLSDVWKNITPTRHNCPNLCWNHSTGRIWNDNDMHILVKKKLQPNPCVFAEHIIMFFFIII